MEEGLGYYSATGEFIEAPKKQIFRLQIPYGIRFAIVWTMFFAIFGAVIQFFQSSDMAFMSVFQNFFTTEYASWFRSFGNFTNVVEYPTSMDFVYSLLGHWYYFFYTGGLIALIWGIISGIINFEVVFKKKPKYEKIKEQAEKTQEYLVHRAKISELLLEGRKKLAAGKIDEAKEIYREIRSTYSLEKDYDEKLKNESLLFYKELLSKEKQHVSKKTR